MGFIQAVALTLSAGIGPSVPLSMCPSPICSAEEETGAQRQSRRVGVQRGRGAGSWGQDSGLALGMPEVFGQSKKVLGMFSERQETHIPMGSQNDQPWPRLSLGNPVPRNKEVLPLQSS